MKFDILWYKKQLDEMGVEARMVEMRNHYVWWAIKGERDKVESAAQFLMDNRPFSFKFDISRTISVKRFDFL